MKKVLRISLISVASLLGAYLLIMFVTLLVRPDLVGKVGREFVALTNCEIDTIYVDELMARRGDIVDCNGHILATSEKVADIYWDSSVASEKEVGDLIEQMPKELATLFKDRTAEEYREVMINARQKGNCYQKITTDVDSATVEKFKGLRYYTDSIFHNGFIIKNHYNRIYPYGSLARRVLGYVKTEGDKELHIGIEGAFDKGLSGQNGYRLVKRNLKSNSVRKLTTVKPKNGITVPTSIDIELQAYADSVLREKLKDVDGVYCACLAIVSTDNGAIQTMVNFTGDEDGRLREVYNHTIASRYSPGMIIAPATALAACKCDPSVDLTKYDITIPGDLRSMSAGCDTQEYLDTLKNLLIGDYTDGHFDISGLLPIQYCKDVANIESYNYRKQTLPCGFGVSGSAYSWLKLHTAIARGGEGISLRFVGLLTDEENHIVNEGILLAPDTYGLCTENQAKIITKSMKESAMNGPFAGSRYEVAGLNGVSRIPSNSSHNRTFQVQASFAGFFPAEDPSFSIICMVQSKTSAVNVSDSKNITSETVREIVNSEIVAERISKNR